MADTAYVIPADALDIRVLTRQITDFPATGTFMSIEKINPLSTAVAGRNGSVTFARNGDKLYRVTLTLMQHHPDDTFMQAAVLAMRETNTVLTFSYKYKATTYLSNAVDIETMPTREYAGDGAPTVAWALTGVFPITLIGGFTQPDVATVEQVESFIP